MAMEMVTGLSGFDNLDGSANPFGNKVYMLTAQGLKRTFRPKVNNYSPTGTANSNEDQQVNWV